MFPQPFRSLAILTIAFLLLAEIATADKFFVQSAVDICSTSNAMEINSEDGKYARYAYGGSCWKNCGYFAYTVYDLGSVKTFTHIYVRGANGLGCGYNYCTGPETVKLGISTDGSTWTCGIYNGQGLPVNSFGSTTFATGTRTARYISIYRGSGGPARGNPAVDCIAFCTSAGECSNCAPLPPPCVRANPTVTISPSSQQATAGTKLTYTLEVKNNDNSACESSTFSLSITSCPSGWTCSLSQNSLTISPGSTASTTIDITSPSTASAGSYTFKVRATNTVVTSYFGEGSGTYVVTSIFDFSLTVAPNSGTVVQGDSTTTTVTATLLSGDPQPVTFSCGGNWLSDWQYRKPVTIDNTLNPSPLTDYQILVTLDTTSLISAGKMQADCSDLRFTDSNGVTQLNYWLESGCNSASTKLWVKVPSIPASATKTIYVYYGNPSATSASNIANTFIPNQIFLVTGRCTDSTYCGYTDNHGEFDYIRARIGTSPFTIDGSGYVTAVNQGSNPHGSSDYYYSRYRFLYLPPTTGTYSFGTNSDDASEVTFLPGDGYNAGGSGLVTPSPHPYGEHDVVAYWYGGHPYGICGSSGTRGSRSLVAGQAIWIDYMQEEWRGGQLAQMCINIPGVGWVVVDAANANYNNRIFARKYVSPEPTLSLGAEETQTITLPPGVTYSFSPSSSCTPTPTSCSLTLTISTSPTTPIGTHTITIIGSGGGVTKTATYSLTVTSVVIGPPTTYTIYPGWNLISPANKTITLIISDPCKVATKKLYYLNRATGRWEEKSWTQLEGGKGYWIFSEAQQTCEIEVSGVGSVSVADIPPLIKGYNLIGSPSIPKTFSTILGTCSGKIEIGPLARDAENQRWEQATILLPKKGYWINVKENCALS